MKRVTAAILLNEGSILIAKRKTTDRLGNMWEFPGGKIEEGETPQECLKREMEEEFGIEVTVGKYIGHSIYHYDHGSIELLAYLTTWAGGDISANSHDDYKWVQMDELKDFYFAPADLPFVEKLRRGEIGF